MASEMPVLPLVGSRMILLGPIKPSRSAAPSIWWPDDLSAAGDSRQDRDGVAAPDRSLQLAQVADVFVVDVDVDELAQLTIRAEQALAETGIALGQVFEHLADVAALGADDLLAG